MVELIVFLICAVIAVAGAVGLVIAKNPVHAALSLVATLFAIAVLFLNQDAQFLAAVQVIVYAGAIVVLFLFVIMLLGVDAAEDLSVEPIAGQRVVALVLAGAVLALSVVFIAVSVDGGATVARSVTAQKVDSISRNFTSATEAFEDDVAGGDDAVVDGAELNPNIDQIGRVLFTRYVFAFEVTALLLTIAVVGAVMLARRPKGELAPLPEPRPISYEEA